VDITDDVDPMTLAINRAAEHLRGALHAGCGARVEPQVLYARASDLISVLIRTQEVAMALSDLSSCRGSANNVRRADDRRWTRMSSGTPWTPPHIARTARPSAS